MHIVQPLFIEVMRASTEREAQEALGVILRLKIILRSGENSLPMQHGQSRGFGEPPHNSLAAQYGKSRGGPQNPLEPPEHPNVLI